MNTATAAIANHLQIAADLIQEIQEWATVLWVRLQGMRPRFVSKKVTEEKMSNLQPKPIQVFIEAMEAKKVEIESGVGNVERKQKVLSRMEGELRFLQSLPAVIFTAYWPNHGIRASQVIETANGAAREYELHHEGELLSRSYAPQWQSK